MLRSIMNLSRKPGKPALWSQGLEEAKAGAGSPGHLPKETRAAGGESVTRGSHPHLHQEAGREAAGPRGAGEQGQPWGPGCSAGLPSSVWGEHEVGGEWASEVRGRCVVGTEERPQQREPSRCGGPHLTDRNRPSEGFPS